MSNKSLVERLKEIEGYRLVLTREDIKTIQEARFLIERVCKAVSEEK